MYGDERDDIKWDFPEDTMPQYIIGGYLYKASTKSRATRLHAIREKINQLCENIIFNIEECRDYAKDSGALSPHGIDIFLEIHNENEYKRGILPEPFASTCINNGGICSRYLLSEMPRGVKWEGLNKPKMRDIYPLGKKVGKDGQGRALYRDVFLNLGSSDIDKLVIHELAHTMANHINFRPDDHKADFRAAEAIIDDHWPW